MAEPVRIVIDPLSLLQLAEDSGLTSGDRLFDSEPEHVQSVDLLAGVDLELFCAAGFIAAGTSRLLARAEHLNACFAYIGNLTSALEASQAEVAELRTLLAVQKEQRSA